MSQSTESATVVDPSNDQVVAGRLRNGVLFLKNPAVRTSSLVNKVAFLKGKGLSIDEISQCFEEAGQPQTKDALRDAGNGIVSQQSASYTPPPPPPAPLAVYPQFVPPVPQQDSWSWKDYFVGGTIGTLAAMGLYQYSPYHVVGKDELDALRRASLVGGRKKSLREPRRRKSAETSLLGDVGDGHFGQSSDGGVATNASLGGLPAPPSHTTAGTIEDRGNKDYEAALEKAQQEVQERAAEAEKARRDKAELAANNGKLKGQLMQVNRSLERSEAEVARLRKRLEEIEKQNTIEPSGVTPELESPVVIASNEDTPIPAGDAPAAD